MLLWAHYALGFTLTVRGSWSLARDHLARSIALYEPRRAGNYGFVQDPGPTAMALLSHVVHSLGYPEQALGRMRDAVTQARNLCHPFTLAWVLGSAAVLHWELGEKSAAQVLWEEQASLSSNHGFGALSALASLRIGFAKVDGGKMDGLNQMRDALASLTGAFIDKLEGLGFLAFAEGKAGQVDLALTRIDEALARAKKSPKYWLTFLLNLTKGQLLLMKSASGLREAKQYFGIAIRIAREQKSKSEELAAAIQLARVLMQQGRRKQARSMLKKIYNWFTEGFDTADLKEAKALLDELSC